MPTFDQLRAFRQAAYERLGKARDATFELTDAVLLTRNAYSLADLSLCPVFRRKWPSIYEALQDSRPQRQKLMKLYIELNSASPSRDPLVSKTVRETFISHGSSMIWCLSRIPHYPFILDFFKLFGGLRFGTIAAGFVTETAIVDSFCVVAMSV